MSVPTIIRVSDSLEIKISELRKFVIEGKLHSYASDAPERPDPLRPGFREPVVFRSGKWGFHDSYAGYYSAIGQEWVTYDDIPIWAMSYNGGMLQQYAGNQMMAQNTFKFLKLALSRPDPDTPARGPAWMYDNFFTYISLVNGNILCFNGLERIWIREKEVANLDFSGGVIIHNF